MTAMRSLDGSVQANLDYDFLLQCRAYIIQRRMGQKKIEEYRQQVEIFQAKERRINNMVNKF